MIRFFIVITLLMIGVCVPAMVDGSGFRCGTWVISRGDTKYEVLAKCGEPDFVELWESVRIRRDYSRGRLYEDDFGRHYEQPFYTREYTVIEEWTYNFGPRKFIRYLRFENGILRRIITGDYGY
jgi:hypothetical protein